ncbi:Fur family transcriptional regulator [Jannaschia formosa]|uniref:Fur family transcriptional regulator n=1 Tax=Jannaschia formosa TaxID=2259592 RepID=UPI000E1C067C|nr:transcriptional repressor [Jannaschia formosa]TFL18940.1 transcriptional repressor [Jannaschia formosa]
MIGFDPHDHSACIRDAVAAADALCMHAGLRLTPVRRRVLEILLERHRAMGAYEILELLRAEGLGSQPPVAYRALDFLTTHGLVHRIERLNAFVACATPGAAHDPAFLICRKCESVAETEADLAPVAAGAGFELEATVVEMQGLCPRCRE